MFSGRFKSVIRGLRFRIAASYFVLFMLSSLLLFAVLYFLLSKTLEEKDHRIIVADFKKFSLLVSSSGVEGLEKWFAQKPGANADVFVHLEDPSGKTVFNHEPAVLGELSRAYFNVEIKRAKDDVITRVESKDDAEDAVEFYTDTLSNGDRLQVGNDSEEREELLARFRNAFAIITIFATLSSLATALVFALKVLRPVRNLISTVERVRRGDLAARAEVKPHGNELNDLATFLNGMLAQNSKLISALTESLDAVAHDLRTPLTRLRVHAERALESKVSDPKLLAAEQQEALGDVLENTDQLIELLDAILDVSEAEAGTLKLRPVQFNLRDFINEVIDVYSIVAEEKAITLVVQDFAPVSIKVDIRMKQAIANLIDNAIKFSPKSSRVLISAQRVEKTIVIAVEDEGPGIGPDEESKIWERLYRGDVSRSERGMGLGLSIVRSIVLAHGGTVKVRTLVREGGKTGSRFEIALPLS